MKLHATPASAITRRPVVARRPSAYQMPSAAIGSPISSPVASAEDAHTANGMQPVGVEEPDAVEEERDREGHRDGRRRAARPCRPRVREIGECEQGGRPLRAEVAPRRARTPAAHRARRRRSADATSVRGDGTDDPERRRGARGSDRRVTRGGLSCSPVTPSVYLERPTMRRAPDRLHHVPEVEPADRKWT